MLAGAGLILPVRTSLGQANSPAAQLWDELVKQFNLPKPGQEQSGRDNDASDNLIFNFNRKTTSIAPAAAGKNSLEYSQYYEGKIPGGGAYCQSSVVVVAHQLDKYPADQREQLMQEIAGGFSQSIAKIMADAPGLKQNREKIGSLTLYHLSGSQAQAGGSREHSGYDLAEERDVFFWAQGRWAFSVERKLSVENASHSCGKQFATVPAGLQWVEATYAASNRIGMFDSAAPTPTAAGKLLYPTIQIERAPLGEKTGPYIGLVADGMTTLKLTITNPDKTRSVTARIEALKAGQLALSTGQAVGGNTLTLLPGSETVLTYTPPEYLAESLLKTSYNLGKSNFGKGETGHSSIYGMDVDIRVDFSNKEWPSALEDHIRFAVFRPPVLLVHGYFGSANTWGKLFNELVAARFDPYMGTYRPGIEASFIEDIAVTLGKDIQGITGRYSAAYLKISRIDIVSHSMGGLVARQYIDSAPDDIRKLLMLATPNHGVNDWQRFTRLLTSYYLGIQFNASFQLNADNAFFNRINAGEVTLQHLAENVEYANLIGRASCGTGCPDDAVVPVASAELNGVPSYIFEKTIHSEALHAIDWYAGRGLNDALNPYFQNSDVGITERNEVIATVIALLNNKINRAGQSFRWSLTLADAQGEVRIQDRTSLEEKAILKTPVELSTRSTVKTGKSGKAVVVFYLNGKEMKRIHLAEQSELLLGVTSLNEMSTWLRSGKGWFYSLHDGQSETKSGGFNLGVGSQPQSPAASKGGEMLRVRDQQTTFVASAEAPTSILVLSGSVKLDTFSTQDVPVAVGATLRENPARLTVIQPDGITSQSAAPSGGWWDDAFYQKEYSAPAWSGESASQPGGSVELPLKWDAGSLQNFGLIACLDGLLVLGAGLFFFLRRRRPQMRGYSPVPAGWPGSQPGYAEAPAYPMANPGSRRGSGNTKLVLIVGAVVLLVGLALIAAYVISQLRIELIL